jgi:hypothetical protein
MEHVQALNEIKARLMGRTLTYDEARLLARPHLDAMNAIARRIAAKHGVRPTLVNFSSFMR